MSDVYAAKLAADIRKAIRTAVCQVADGLDAMAADPEIAEMSAGDVLRVAATAARDAAAKTWPGAIRT